MRLPTETLGNKFYVPCVLRGKFNYRLLALVDTGSSVTAVNGAICRHAGLEYAGERITSCVHKSHTPVAMRTYFCTLDIGGSAIRLIVQELGDIEEDDGSPVIALLGRNVLERYRAAMDWPRIMGMLEA